MGAVYRKAYTMPLPAGAEIVERGGMQIAGWRLRNGKARTAEVAATESGEIRLRGRSAFFTAQYRDGGGQVVEVSTGCRDDQLPRGSHLLRQLVPSYAAPHAEPVLRRSPG